MTTTTYWNKSRYIGDKYPWEIRYTEGCDWAAQQQQEYMKQVFW